MIIFDNETAVLPLNPACEGEGISVHRDPAVLCALSSLFESFWLSATPLGLTLPFGGEQLSRAERALLESLSLGRIDREIAQDMGVSMSTVARRIAEIMERLNARTRFEAACKAVKKNWL